MGAKKELFNILEFYFDTSCLAGLGDSDAQGLGDQMNRTIFGQAGVGVNQTTDPATLEAQAFLDSMMAPLRFDQTVFAALAFVVFVWLVMQGKVPRPDGCAGQFFLTFWIICNILQMVSYLLSIAMVFTSYASMTRQYGSCLQTWGGVPLLHILTGATFPMQPAIAHKFLGLNTCTVAMFTALKHFGDVEDEVVVEKEEEKKGEEERDEENKGKPETKLKRRKTEDEKKLEEKKNKKEYWKSYFISRLFEALNYGCVMVGYFIYSMALAVWFFSASFVFSIVFLPFSQFAYILVVEVMLMAHALGKVRKAICKRFGGGCGGHCICDEKRCGGDDEETAWILNSLQGVGDALEDWKSFPATSIFDFILLVVPFPFIDCEYFHEMNTSIGKMTHFAISFILFSQMSIIGLMLAILTYSGKSGSEIMSGLYLNFYADCFQGMQLPDFADLAALDTATVAAWLSSMAESLEDVSPVVPLQGSKVMACISMLLAAIKSVTIGLVLFLTGVRACCGCEIKSIRLAQAVATKEKIDAEDDAKEEIDAAVQKATKNGENPDAALENATKEQAKASSKGSSKGSRLQRWLRIDKKKTAESLREADVDKKMKGNKVKKNKPEVGEAEVGLESQVKKNKPEVGEAEVGLESQGSQSSEDVCEV